MKTRGPSATSLTWETSFNQWIHDYIYYKTGPVVQEEKIFKFRECTFAMLLLSPNEKRCGLSICTSSNPLYPKMLFAKFGWIWPSGSIEEDFWSMYFRYILITLYLLLEKGGALHLNNLIYPSPKDGLCQVWLKLDQWFWRWRFF